MPRLARSLASRLLTAVVVAATAKAVTAALKVVLDRSPKAAVR